MSGATTNANIRRLQTRILHFPLVDPITYRLSRRDIQRRMKDERGLDDILETVINDNPGYGRYALLAWQIREELAELARLVRKRKPQTVLEIGTAKGGTFYVWCRYVDSIDKAISLDLPGGQFGGGYTERQTALFERFDTEVDTRFVMENSHEQSTVNRIRDDILEEDESIDFLFVDGDHTYEGVKRDFELYRDLVGDDGLIAFHDIALHPDDPSVAVERRKNIDAPNRYFMWGTGHPDCSVDAFWEEIRDEYTTREITAHPKQTWGGIGVVDFES